MTSARRASGLPLALSLALLCGCAARGRSPSTASPHATVGVYRGLLVPAEGPPRRFRTLLFAAPPDRLHAEVLSPLGSTVWILDAGEGSLAVTAVGEARSYVGPAEPAAIEQVLGLEMSLADLVDALLTGAGRDARYAIRRSGDAGELPRRFEIRWAEGALELERKSSRSAPLTGRIARGIPPEGTLILPLAELELEGAGLLALPPAGP